MILWHDCETVGLQGPVKLNQFSVDNGPVQMIKTFKGWEKDKAVRAELWKLLDLLDKPDTTYIGFNIAFDLFHLYRLKHRLLGHEYNSSERPIMPFACKVIDLQVHAMQKSILAPFAFGRSSSKSVAMVRRIPKAAMAYVSDLVVTRLKKIVPSTFEISISVHKDNKQPNLVSLSFKLKGRVSLKGLMKEYQIPTIELADVWPLPAKGTEKPWLPYPDPAVHDPIEHHCDIVMSNPKSRFYTYSELDILYLKVLYDKLNKPECDYNSSCCHNMAYLRYYGFDLDKEKLDEAKNHYGNIVNELERDLAGTNLRSPKSKLELLKPYFPLLASVNKATLKKLADTEEGKGAELCKAIVNYGPSRQRLLQIQKVAECETGKAHPDLRVMGTATNRMAGVGGVNYQGIGAADEIEISVDIKEQDEVPEELLEQWLAAEGQEFIKMETVGLRNAIRTPCVGDWSGFEIGIAEAIYEDEQLHEDLVNGISLHSMGATQFHPDIKDLNLSYEEFQAGYETNSKWYKARKGIKSVIFGSFYFCTAHAVSASLGILEGEAQKILDGLYERYPGMGRYRKQIEADFLTADVETWSRGSVKKMKRSLKDLTGFERRWDFEAKVAEIMWELGHTKIQSGLEGQVIRSAQKGLQTMNNAIKSAFLGSAIAVQAAVSRQAGNMRIQATGASLNKVLQAETWERLRIPTLNIHDENIPPHHPNFNMEEYSKLINEFTEKAKAIVPMLDFKFDATEYWSDKR